MVPDFSPKAFASCWNENCNHVEVWELKQKKIPETFACPKCGFFNGLEKEPGVSHGRGVTTEIKVIFGFEDLMFDD